MAYYEDIAGPKLADEFYRELRGLMHVASERPHSFSPRTGDLRRANLRRFPYHFFFRLVEDDIRILVVRHHRSHPSVGIRRR